MTSEVMAPASGCGHAAAMSNRWAALVVFLPFFAYSVWVALLGARLPHARGALSRGDAAAARPLLRAVVRDRLDDPRCSPARTHGVAVRRDDDRAGLDRPAHVPRHPPAALRMSFTALETSPDDLS